MRAGPLIHSVSVWEMNAQTGGASTPYTELFPSPVHASIQPLAPGTSTDDRTITHQVTIRYHPLVTLDCYLLYGTRKLFIRGIQNVDERNVQLTLLCEETQ